MSCRVYPLPSEEKLSEAYAVSAGGENVPVRCCFVSAYPYNRRWPGHQRGTEQREEAYFVSFEADFPIELKITPKKPFKNVVVRPLSKNVEPRCENGEITLLIPSPGGYSLEPDGYHGALHIFADPIKDYGDMSGKRVIYFGPGVHRPGLILLQSYQTLYIDAGAVVYGHVVASDARNIKILGRGVLDSSENKEVILFDAPLGDGHEDVRNSFRQHTIRLDRCRKVLLDGITIRDSLVYNVAAWDCEDLIVDNLKIIGDWRYNSDGIDLHNCRRCVVRNCFVRTFDDSICVKGHDGCTELCDDILIENCVVWCDWDHSLEIGAETQAENMQNITFRNCDVIRSTGVVLDILNVDYGHVHDVLFEDIRVEYDPVSPPPQIQPDDSTPYNPAANPGFMPSLIYLGIIWHHEFSSKTRTERGRISNIRFRNIRVFAPKLPPIEINGFDEEHKVSDVEIDGLYLNGEKLDSLPEAALRCRFAQNISFR